MADTDPFDETFETVVDEIVIENIDEGGQSIVELKMPLCLME